MLRRVELLRVKLLWSHGLSQWRQVISRPRPITFEDMDTATQT